MKSHTTPLVAAVATGGLGRLLLALAVTLQVACQSAPAKHYYLLQAPTPSQWQQAEPIGQTVGIGPITLAEFLNRPQVAVQADNGDLLLDTNHVWAEPLQAGIARVIALQLTGANASRASIEFPWRQDNQPELSVRLNLQSLQLARDQLVLSGTWELREHPDKQRLTYRHFHRQQPASRDPKDIAKALSALLRAWADDINTQLAATAD